MNNALRYCSLVAVNLLYASVMLFTRSAAEYDFISWQYILWFIGAVVVMGVYAVCWQQILRRTELSMAYMFKGMSIVFVMLLAYIFFDEAITWNNLLGAAIIILGIALYVKE